MRHDRRDGWDLIFAAPKSVSLLAALVAEAPARTIATGHGLAVSEAVGYLERNAIRTRRRRHGRPVAATGLLGALFTHDANWIGDPHLHSHLVVPNLVFGADDRWSALDGLGLYHHAAAAGAVYQAGLRYHLARLGLAAEWIVHDSGLADLGAVPRGAIDAVSGRRRQVLAETGRLDSARQRQAAAGRSRQRSAPGAHQGRWELEATTAGFGPQEAAAMVSAGDPRANGLVDGGADPPRAPSRPRAAGAPEPSGIGDGDGALEHRLGRTGSTFSRPDVVLGASALQPRGATARELEAIADRFLAAAQPVSGYQWTTAAIERNERGVVERVTTGRPVRCGLASPAAVAAVIAERPDLDPVAVAALRQLVAGRPVDVIGRGSLLAQATVLDAARAAWQSAGHRVAVISGRQSRAPVEQRRWQVLAGIDPPGNKPATVLVVTDADRLPAADLDRLLADGRRRATKTVLVFGTSEEFQQRSTNGQQRSTDGILPALGLALGVVEPGSQEGLAGLTPAAVRTGDVVIALSTAAVFGRLVSDWAEDRKIPGGMRESSAATRRRSTMVALGPAEADILNRMARSWLAGAGRLHGPELTAGPRSFRAGDEVRALRALPGVTSGTVGQVTGVDPDRRCLSVEWPQSSAVVAGSSLHRLGHAYATTPAYLRAVDGPALALARPGHLPPHRAPTTCYLALGASQVPVAAGHGSSGLVASACRELADLRPAAADPGRPRAELIAARDACAAVIRGAPEDNRAELRRLGEEQDWLRSLARPDRLRSELVDRRLGELEGELRHRRVWLESHRPELEQWAGLERALHQQDQALAFAAEVAPGPNHRSRQNTVDRGVSLSR